MHARKKKLEKNRRTEIVHKRRRNKIKRMPKSLFEHVFIARQNEKIF